MKLLTKKKTVFIISAVLLLTATVGSMIAFVFTSTGKIDNTFTPSLVSCAIVENGSTTEHYRDTVSISSKSDVRIKNTGDTNAYIRVAVIISWKSADGKVWAVSPSASDYEITLAQNSGWELAADGYCYYTSQVSPTACTNALFELIEQKNEGPKGADGTQYFLSVEIVASAIQSSPDEVVTSAWSSGVSSASGGTLTVKRTGN